jgi:hypothetical protein
MFLDFDSNSLFAAFFAELSKVMKTIGVETYGIQATTLENIFHGVTNSEVPTLVNPYIKSKVEKFIEEAEDSVLLRPVQEIIGMKLYHKWD